MLAPTPARVGDREKSFRTSHLDGRRRGRGEMLTQRTLLLLRLLVAEQIDAWPWDHRRCSSRRKYGLEVHRKGDTN